MTMFAESLRTFLKPVAAYLDDDSITEVLINGPDDIWIERQGRLIQTSAKFTEEGLLAAARNVAQSVGRRLWEEQPQLDARLPDGSRIHIVLPPIARRGVVIAIRKFPKERLTLEDLFARQALTAPMARVIEAAIQMKLNLVVSGGTGSGKTTMLNVVSAMIPEGERVVTIEDSAELELQHRHLVSLESRLPDKSGRGGIDLGDLLLSALRLRPDRIVIGEIRGPECFHFMQALNTGHGGSMCTCHANTALETLRRIESLALIGAPAAMPSVAIRAQIASAIDIIVCCNRFPDGARKVTAISEVLPLDAAGEYQSQDIFVYAPVRREPDGTLVGYHSPTGLVADFAEEARAFGYRDLTDEFFDPATYDLPAPLVSRADRGHAARWAPSLRHREKGLPDPETVKAKRSSWEATLSVPRPRVPPPSPLGMPRLVTGEQSPGPLRTGSGRANLEVVPLSQLEPAKTGSEPKVELSPDLVAELDELGVSLEVTPAQGPGDKTAPAVPKKGA